MKGTTCRGLDGAPATPNLWNERWDVVVVGARVAGATTAMHLARAGHRVLILDRAGPPKDTVSTHALMRSGVLQLRKAGVLERIVDAGTPPIRQVNLVFADQQIKFSVAEGLGVDAYYAPRRTLLDTVLLEAAIDAGATFLGGSVSEVSHDSQGRVNGVKVRTATGEPTIHARWVVGADGTHSRVARSVGAKLLRHHPPTNGLVYAYFEGAEVPGYDFRFVDQRNVGAIPTNDGLTILFVGGPLVDVPRDAERYLMATFTRIAPDLVAGARRMGRLYQARSIPNLLRDPAGPGWCLVGDAGFTEDPISAHGMTDALRDAEFCADAVDRSLRDPGGESDALSSYRRLRDRFAVPYLDHIVALSSFAWDGPEASRLMRGLGEIADAECELLASRSLIPA